MYVITANGSVKIGISTNPDVRFRGLANSSAEPLTLVATFADDRGGKALESELHARWAEYRTHGEWFRLEGELAEWVDSLRGAR